MFQECRQTEICFRVSIEVRKNNIFFWLNSYRMQTHSIRDIILFLYSLFVTVIYYYFLFIGWTCLAAYCFFLKITFLNRISLMPTPNDHKKYKTYLSTKEMLRHKINAVVLYTTRFTRNKSIFIKHFLLYTFS